MVNQLPAKEQVEEGTKALAEMCALFWKTLILEHVPEDVAFEMAMIFTSSVVPTPEGQSNDD